MFLLYLKLFLLCETFSGLACRGLADETHTFDEGSVSVQHLGDLIHTVTVLGKDHDPCRAAPC